MEGTDEAVAIQVVVEGDLMVSWEVDAEMEQADAEKITGEVAAACWEMVDYQQSSVVLPAYKLLSVAVQKQKTTSQQLLATHEGLI